MSMQGIRAGGKGNEGITGRQQGGWQRVVVGGGKGSGSSSSRWRGSGRRYRKRWSSPFTPAMLATLKLTCPNAGREGSIQVVWLGGVTNPTQQQQKEWGGVENSGEGTEGGQHKVMRHNIWQAEMAEEVFTQIGEGSMFESGNGKQK